MKLNYEICKSYAICYRIYPFENIEDKTKIYAGNSPFRQYLYLVYRNVES